MTCQGYNIKIVEGNAFALVLPLKRRTFVSERPIDEDIDILSLENVVVKIGGVIYANTLEEDGVHVLMPATLSRGTYQIELTAVYQGSAIRAAYFEAFTIVAWNYQSDAQQYIAGSPIVLNAAYVIGGTLTDAELEALKEEYREKNAQLDQAIEDAEEAKREWEQKAADLDGVAQEATSQTILNAVENIDFSSLAKEATLGTPQEGQPSTIFAAIAESGRDSKQTIVDAISHMGGSASADMTWAELAQVINGLPTASPYTTFKPNVAMPINVGDFILGRYSISNIDEFYSEYSGSISTRIFRQIPVSKVTLPYATLSMSYVFEGCSAREIYMPSTSTLNNGSFSYCRNLVKLNIINISTLGTDSSALGEIPNLIDLIIGAAFASSMNILQYTGYNPTQAYRTDTSSLCFDTDLEEYGQVFANNFEKWKWCIINHFAANLQDRTGLTAYTITFGSTVLSHFDAEMIAAFTDKNWTLA